MSSAYQHGCLKTQYNWTFTRVHCVLNYIHCLGLKFSASNSFTSNSSSLFELAVGLKTFGFPYTAQGSLPNKELPKHHPPGVNPPLGLLNIWLSILSGTGSSEATTRANGAPLLTIRSKCSVVRLRGCWRGGLSRVTKRRSWLTVVFWKSWELQMTVWK